VTRKAVIALVTVLVAQAPFALCLVSALPLLVPRNVPFGAVGPSEVLVALTSKISDAPAPPAATGPVGG
jgi:hypothetical protein